MKAIRIEKEAITWDVIKENSFSLFLCASYSLTIAIKAHMFQIIISFPFPSRNISYFCSQKKKSCVDRRLTLMTSP